MTRKRSYLLVAFEACQVNRKDNLFEYELTWIQKKANGLEHSSYGDGYLHQLEKSFHFWVYPERA